MRITKRQLRRLINQEVEALREGVVNEGKVDRVYLNAGHKDFEGVGFTLAQEKKLDQLDYAILEALMHLEERIDALTRSKGT